MLLEGTRKHESPYKIKISKRNGLKDVGRQPLKRRGHVSSHDSLGWVKSAQFFPSKHAKNLLAHLGALGVSKKNIQ